MLDTFKKYIFAPAIALALAAVASMASSCDRHKPTDSSTSGITTLICDATIQNIISQEVDVFEFTYPKASIMTWYTDEHSAIDSLVTMKSSLIITARQLTDKQKEYAAIDAWACIKLYNEIMQLMATHDYELKVVEEKPAE